MKCFKPHELDPQVFVVTAEDRTIDCRDLIAHLLSEPGALANHPYVLPLCRRVLAAEAEAERLRGEVANLRMTQNPPMQ